YHKKTERHSAWGSVLFINTEEENAMSSNLSRRSLVSSAAALPALAMPAIAMAAATEPDPIHHALKACIEAERVNCQFHEKEEEAGEAFKAKYGQEEPSGFSKISRDRLAAAPDAPHEKIADFTRRMAEMSMGTHDAIDELGRAFGDRAS